MATVVDQSVIVGSNGEPWSTSNTGFNLDSTSPFGLDLIRVTNSGGVNSAYNTSTGHSYMYEFNTAPADKNQSVTLRIRRRTHDVGTYWWVLLRRSTNNWVYATFSGDANKPVTMGKYVAGVGTSLGSHNDSSRLSSDGAEGDLTLETVGTSAPFNARVLWNSVQVIAPVAISDAALNIVGKACFAQRTFNQDLQTTLYHATRFTVLDGVGGGGGGTAPVFANQRRHRR
jgi:hypothetical protein